MTIVAISDISKPFAKCNQQVVVTRGRDRYDVPYDYSLKNLSQDWEDIMGVTVIRCPKNGNFTHLKFKDEAHYCYWLLRWS